MLRARHRGKVKVSPSTTCLLLTWQGDGEGEGEVADLGRGDLFVLQEAVGAVDLRLHHGLLRLQHPAKQGLFIKTERVKKARAVGVRWHLARRAVVANPSRLSLMAWAPAASLSLLMAAQPSACLPSGSMKSPTSCDTAIRLRKSPAERLAGRFPCSVSRSMIPTRLLSPAASSDSFALASVVVVDNVVSSAPS